MAKTALLGVLGPVSLTSYHSFQFQCLCVYASVCAHTCGGQSSASDVIPQALSILFLRQSLTGLGFMSWARLVGQQ